MPKVLIVDDSPASLQLMAMTLQRNGFVVLTAAQGDDVVATAVRERADLVVLDIVLPGQNGFQLCRHLKQDDRTRAIPVILVSSKNTTLDKQWGLRQGAAAYLVKPFQPEEFLDCVQRLL
jgi:DNA-binding response OmpR family regulator